MSDYQTHTIVTQPFAENTYILQFEGRDDCLVVDPGLEPQKIIDRVERLGATPAAFLCTQGHADHIGGNAAMKHRWPDVPLVIGSGDADKLVDPAANLSQGFGLSIVSPAADVLLSDGEHYSVAGFDFLIHEIPGHSSGHIVFICEDVDPPFVVGGDVLFAGSIGRTDFPDGSFEALRDGIHNKLFRLPDNTRVLAGHGDETTIGTEKRTNPFVGLG